MLPLPNNTDVVIIGAGPSGAIAAALLQRQGHQVLVLEREVFPRFSIGESLLPQCMTFIEEAGMLEAVNAYGFQLKDGAAFARGDKYADFDFHEKFTEGPATTFQVERAHFDKLLADQAAEQGVDIRYGHTITGVDFDDDQALVTCTDSDGEMHSVSAKFILDASGFGRVLPRLLQLETPSDFPVRKAMSTHIDDHIAPEDFDRNKILITIHPVESDIWYWTNPLNCHKCSIGVVAPEAKIDARPGDTIEEKIRNLIAEAPSLQWVVRNAEFNYPARAFTGYAANVKSLAGDKYALLGNAGEFLDPMFSSGITIAMQSSSLASKVLHRQLSGESVDWQAEYAEPLKKGIETFRVFVDAWYDGSFPEVIFFEDKVPAVQQMVCSIVAGYAWDEKNPFVAEPFRRLRALAELCREETDTGAMS